MRDESAPTQDSRRLPAEWEPHRATWLTWPHQAGTWPCVHGRATDAFRELIRALRRFEPVRLLVPDDETAEHVNASGEIDGDAPLEILVVPTDDSWTRDFAPICVEVHDGSILATIWRFDSWGGKYPFAADAAAGQILAERAGLSPRRIDHVLEGGSIDTDGQGSILTTRSCLLNPNRQRTTEAAVESLLSVELGGRSLIWLDDGIVGDDTDGHVDDLARFVSPGRVVVASEPDPADPNHDPLGRARAGLSEARDADGNRLEVVELPMPLPVHHDGERLPASYANFYILNGAVIVPTFRCHRDDLALGILADLFPGRTVLGVESNELVVGLGAIHCLTMQEPAPKRG